MSSDLSINEFCDIQGVPNHHRFALNIMHKKSGKKTYDQWYDLLKNDFSLNKKDFTKAAETLPNTTTTK